MLRCSCLNADSSLLCVYTEYGDERRTFPAEREMERKSAVKKYTRVAKWCIPLGTVLILAGVICFFALYCSYPPGGDLWTDKELAASQKAGGYFGRGMVFLVIGMCLLIPALITEDQRRDGFQRIFGFDPRPGKQELVDDPQTTVSHKVESLRLHAQSLFEVERVRQAGKEKLQADELTNLIERKLKAKEAFWDACKAARLWGYRIPGSINESALPQKRIAPMPCMSE
jgi:hypothetical protein